MTINYAHQPHELVGLALEWLRDHERVALATLVNIEGNAPYPVGSQMLVREDGRFKGQITGGCAETAIADQAIEAIKLGANSIHRYGLDSPYFDIKLPCGSGIDVVFDVEMSCSDFELIQHQLDARQIYTQPIALSTFIKTYRPNQRLILFGQGPILVSLASLAIQTGFDVVCYAQNKETHKLLSDAELKASDLPTQECDFIDFCDAHTAIVSLFHEHDLETSILAKALQTELFYIGALGSQRTHANRLDNLRADGITEDLLAKIHGPVGMDIKASTPAQIAISILAEVIGALNERNCIQ